MSFGWAAGNAGTVGFVFQDAGLFPWRTVWDNVKLGLEIRGIAGEELNRRVTSILDIVGLGGFERYYPYQPPAGWRSGWPSPGHS